MLPDVGHRQLLYYQMKYCVIIRYIIRSFDFYKYPVMTYRHAVNKTHWHAIDTNLLEKYPTLFLRTPGGF